MIKKIYCIENISNGKKYVGFSSNPNLKMRLSQHACGKAGNTYESLTHFCEANSVNRDNIHRGRTEAGYKYKGFVLEFAK